MCNRTSCSVRIAKWNDDGYTYPCPDSGYCLEGGTWSLPDCDADGITPESHSARYIYMNMNAQGHWCRIYTDDGGTCVRATWRRNTIVGGGRTL